MGGHTVDHLINASQTCNQGSQPLTFLTLNTCGLKSKIIIPEFCDFISQYDIIGLQETKSDNLDSFEIPGFIMYFKHRKNCSKRKSGGIGIAYRKCLSNYISIIETESKLVIWFKISNQLTKQGDILCGVVYIPPEYSPYSVENPFF